MNRHVKADHEARGKPSSSGIVDRLERMLARDPDALLPQAVLRKESLWKGLPPESALRWATLAQVAGLPDLSRQVLEWTNEIHPAFLPAWGARLDLLRSLGLDAEAADLARRRPSAGQSGEDEVSSVMEIDSAGRSWGEAPEDAIAAPFKLMRREEEQLARYLRLFQGREDCFARQWVDRKTAGQGYMPVRRPLEPADVQDHIRGTRTYGIYLLRKDSRICLAVVDADLVMKLRTGTPTSQERETLRREKGYLLERLPEIARGMGFESLAEFSGGKGFHFWFFFEEPVGAAPARRMLGQVVRRIEPDLSCFSLEVFPKQDQLAGKGLGNLVKLPLGVHRVTGKQSFFVHAPDRTVDGQMRLLDRVRLIPADRLTSIDAPALKGHVVAHPSSRALAEAFPELEILGDRCAAIGQILAGCRRSRELSVREEKILLGTLGFLPRGRALLHHVLQSLPDYNPHLIDYKLSRLRGTPLGCKRIHSLLGLVRDLCEMPPGAAYAHPLLHWPEWSDTVGAPRSERCTNLGDALENLKIAIGTVQRFLQPASARPTGL